MKPLLVLLFAVLFAFPALAEDGSTGGIWITQAEQDALNGRMNMLIKQAADLDRIGFEQFMEIGQLKAKLAAKMGMCS